MAKRIIPKGGHKYIGLAKRKLEQLNQRRKRLRVHHLTSMIILPDARLDLSSGPHEDKALIAGGLRCRFFVISNIGVLAFDEKREMWLNLGIPKNEGEDLTQLDTLIIFKGRLYAGGPGGVYKLGLGGSWKPYGAATIHLPPSGYDPAEFASARIFALHEHNGQLYAGGYIEKTNGDRGTLVKRYNRENDEQTGKPRGWDYFGSPVIGTPSFTEPRSWTTPVEQAVMNFITYQQDLWACGFFRQSSSSNLDINANGIARFDGAAWQPADTDSHDFTAPGQHVHWMPTPRSFAIHNDELLTYHFDATRFEDAQQPPPTQDIHGIGRWTGSTWAEHTHIGILSASELMATALSRLFVTENNSSQSVLQDATGTPFNITSAIGGRIRALGHLPVTIGEDDEAEIVDQLIIAGDFQLVAGAQDNELSRIYHYDGAEIVSMDRGLTAAGVTSINAVYTAADKITFTDGKKINE